jgi:hypothetical protein
MQWKYALVALGVVFTLPVHAEGAVKRFGMMWETVMTTHPLRGLGYLPHRYTNSIPYAMSWEDATWPAVVVTSVECGSDADRKGVHVGDILMRVNDEPVLGVTAIYILDMMLEKSTYIPSLIVERYGNVDQYFYDLQPGLGNGDFSCGLDRG